MVKCEILSILLLAVVGSLCTNAGVKENFNCLWMNGCVCDFVCVCELVLYCT